MSTDLIPEDVSRALREIGDGPAPAPSAELQRIFAWGLPTPPLRARTASPARRSKSHWVLAVVAAAAMGAGLTATAAGAVRVAHDHLVRHTINHPLSPPFEHNPSRQARPETGGRGHVQQTDPRANPSRPHTATTPPTTAPDASSPPSPGAPSGTPDATRPPSSSDHSSTDQGGNTQNSNDQSGNDQSGNDQGTNTGNRQTAPSSGGDSTTSPQTQDQQS